MSHKNRWILMVVALVFAGCGGNTGLSESKADSGTPGSGNSNPDTAVPDTVDASPVAPDAPEGTVNLAVSPMSGDFGPLDVGLVSAPIVFTVTNTGTATSGPLVVTATGAGLSVLGCSGKALAPQASCTISITALPTMPGGPFSGTIDVYDILANARTIPIKGVGTHPGNLALSPSPLDLGPAHIGEKVSGTLVLTNGSIADMSGIQISVSGTGFSLSSIGACADTLAPNQSCNIVVTFTAGATLGPAKGTLSASVGGVTKQVPMTATVQSSEATLALTPQSASLQTTVGTPSPPFTFTVSGDVSSAFTVTIAGVNKDDFAFTTSCPTVDAGASGFCQVTVVFNPKTPSATSATAILTVAGPAPGAVATATLAGTATPSTTPANPVDLIPVDNTVSGWTIDTENHTGGSKAPLVASTKDMGGSLIDGGIEPFYTDGFSPQLFVWQDYYNTHLPTAPADSLNPKGAMLTLYMFRMSSADQASGLYKNLLKFSEYTRKVTATSNGWEEPTTPLVGAQSRIQDTGADWWINFYKDEYYVEIRLTPSNGPAPDFEPGNLDLKKEALRFAQVVAQRL